MMWHYNSKNFLYTFARQLRSKFGPKMSPCLHHRSHGFLDFIPSPWKAYLRMSSHSFDSFSGWFLEIHLVDSCRNPIKWSVILNIRPPKLTPWPCHISIQQWATPSTWGQKLQMKVAFFPVQSTPITGYLILRCWHLEIQLPSPNK